MEPITVVIPTLNEELYIARCLGQFKTMKGEWELIVADGGSKDQTLDIASKYRNVKIVHSPKGRAIQMNRGAKMASSPIIIFLHADTILPKNTYKIVNKTLKNKKTVGGYFKIQITPEWGDGYLIRSLTALTDFQRRFSLRPFGDQAIFLKTEAFERIKGYRELPIMEDYDLACRLKRLGQLKCLNASVKVSARGLAYKAINDTIRHWVIPILYHTGIPCDLLCNLIKQQK